MSKSWQIYRSRLIERVVVYSLIFGLGYIIFMCLLDPVNCEVDCAVDRVETRVKI